VRADAPAHFTAAGREAFLAAAGTRMHGATRCMIRAVADALAARMFRGSCALYMLIAPLGQQTCATLIGIGHPIRSCRWVPRGFSDANPAGSACKESRDSRSAALSECYRHVDAA
jgi:hypothetical protein